MSPAKPATKPAKKSPGKCNKMRQKTAPRMTFNENYEAIIKNSSGKYGGHSGDLSRKCKFNRNVMLTKVKPILLGDKEFD